MSTRLVIIDSRVADIEALLENLDPDFERLILTQDEDGVHQIAAYLAANTDFYSIDIVSYGSVGTLYLGTATLNSSTLPDYPSEFEAIRGALVEGGDLLLYGSNVGSGDAGQQFIDDLSGAIGVDVAANDDLSGRLTNAELEVQSGDVNADPLDLSFFIDTLVGLGGTSESEQINGSSANETIFPGAGSDTIDGGGGIDTLWLPGNLSDYFITPPAPVDLAQGVTQPPAWLISGPAGEKTIQSIEKIGFVDASISLIASQPKTDIQFEQLSSVGRPQLASASDGNLLYLWTKKIAATDTDAEKYKLYLTKISIETRELLQTIELGESGTEISSFDIQRTEGGDSAYIVNWAGYGSNGHIQLIDEDFHLKNEKIFQVDPWNSSGYNLNLANWKVLSLDDGGFISAWVKPYEDIGQSVVFDRYDANGDTVELNVSMLPIFSEALAEERTESELFILDTTGWEVRNYQLCGAMDGGWWLVVEASPTLNNLTDDAYYDYNEDLFVAKFSKAGERTGFALVNQERFVEQYEPSIAELSNGNLVISWADNAEDYEIIDGEYRDIGGGGLYSNGVSARVFSPDVEPIGDAFYVNEFLRDQQNHNQVVATPDGGFAISWVNDSFNLWGFDSTVLMRKYDSSVQPLTSEFRLSVITEFNEDYYTELASAPDGTLINARGYQGWVSFIEPEIQYGLQIVATKGDLTLNGTSNNDIILALEGDNLIDGEAGADIMIGGGGDDTFFVDNINDIAADGADISNQDPKVDHDTVLSVVDYSLLDGIEDLFLIGSEARVAIGNFQENYIKGNDNDNRLSGVRILFENQSIVPVLVKSPFQYSSTATRDTLEGGFGDDVYYVTGFEHIVEESDAGNDTVYFVININNGLYTLPENVENLILATYFDTQSVRNRSTGSSAQGNDLSNAIVGTFLNDHFSHSLGQDSIDGGGGYDEYIIEESINSYEISSDPLSGLTHILSRNGSLSQVSLKSVEKINFSDSSLLLSSAAYVGGQLQPDTLFTNASQIVFPNENGGTRSDLYVRQIDPLDSIYSYSFVMIDGVNIQAQSLERIDSLSSKVLSSNIVLISWRSYDEINLYESSEENSATINLALRGVDNTGLQSKQLEFAFDAEGSGFSIGFLSGGKIVMAFLAYDENFQVALNYTTYNSQLEVLDSSVVAHASLGAAPILDIDDATGLGVICWLDGNTIISRTIESDGTISTDGPILLSPSEGAEVELFSLTANPSVGWTLTWTERYELLDENDEIVAASISLFSIDIDIDGVSGAQQTLAVYDGLQFGIGCLASEKLTDTKAVVEWTLFEIDNEDAGASVLGLILEQGRVPGEVFQVNGRDFATPRANISIAADENGGWVTYWDARDSSGSPVQARSQTFNSDGTKSGVNNFELLGDDNAQSFVGGLGNDSLYGAGGDDSLTASEGDDSVFGGDGDDTLVGGTGLGDDYYNGGPGLDLLKFTSATDSSPLLIDMQKGTAVGTDIGSDLFVDVEGIIGGQGDDTIVGDSLDNLLDGYLLDDSLEGAGGNDTLIGGAGDDRLVGGPGDDSLDGGLGDDLAEFTGARADYIIQFDPDTLEITVTDLRDTPANEGTDTLSGIEHFKFNDGTFGLDRAAQGTLSVQGSPAEGERLFAELTDCEDPDGDIVLTGFQWERRIGDQWSAIEDASDSIFLIPDDQSLVGQAIRVIATTQDKLGGVTEFVSDELLIQNVNDAPVGEVTILDKAKIDDTLTAKADFTDEDGLGSLSYQWFANGVAINDAIESTYTVSAEESGTSVTVEVSYTDYFGNFEQVLSNASTVAPNPGVVRNGTRKSDTLFGSDNDDTLIGANGNDVMRGLAGKDLLDGGAGTDEMDGGDGSDVYLISSTSEHKAAEIYDTGFFGTDEARFDAISASTLTLYAGDLGLERVVLGTGTGFAANRSGTVALNVNASAVANGLEILGNDGHNTLLGTAYADRLEGGAGDDQLVGDDGDDQLVGDDGDDLLIDGAGADTLIGGAGNDRLEVQDGGNTLTGGDGADAFVIHAASALANQITDFTLADLIELSVALVNIGEGDGISVAAGEVQYSMTGTTTTVYVGLDDDPGMDVTLELLNFTTPEALGFEGNLIKVVPPQNTPASGTITIEGTPEVGQLLTVDVSGIVDPDGVGTLSYQWKLGGNLISSATADTYTPVSGDTGQTLSVTVSYVDGFGYSESLDSASTSTVLAPQGENWSGTAGNDIKSSTAGDDTLNGLAGNDQLDGLGGNDQINGGTGADVLTGGDGTDTFVFAAGDSGQITGFDRITDFTKGVAGVGDLIDYQDSLDVGNSVARASTNAAKINASTGVAQFARKNGTTLTDALVDVAGSFAAAGDFEGAFALFQVNKTGNYYLFISDGTDGVTPDDVVVQLTGITSVSSIDLTGGNLTILA
jgi:Ca2+-binding RTX toxin-like protein